MSVKNFLNLTSSITSKGSIGALALLATMGMTSVAKADNSWDYDTVDHGTVSKDLSNVNHTRITVNSQVGVVSGNMDIYAGDRVTVGGTGSIFAYKDNRANVNTQILGRLNANSDMSIVMVDRDGVFFGADSVVNVGSLVVATGQIDDDQLINGKDGTFGKFDVTDFGTGGIELNGSITVAEAGIAAFVSPTVVNNGIIRAKLGTVAMAAGERVTVDLYGDSLIEIAAGDSIAALLENNGTIRAEGGEIIMDAQTARDSVNTVINMNGVANVSSATVQGGKIVLSSGKKSKVTVRTGSTMNARGTDGGNIELEGGIVEIGKDTKLFADTNSAGNGGNIKLVAHRRSSSRGLLSATGTNGTVDVTATEQFSILDKGNFSASKIRAEFVNIDAPIVNLDGDIESANITGTANTVNVLGSTNNAEIQDAVDLAVAGATVNVGAGTYRESVTINKGLSVLGAGKDSVFIRPNSPGFRINGGGEGQLITLSGFTVENSTDYGVLIENTADYDSVTIQNAHFAQNDENGVAIFGTSTTGSNVDALNIEDTTFLDNGNRNATNDGSGDVLAFYYNGDLSLKNVDIQNNLGRATDAADYGIQVRGADAFASSGTLSFENVSVKGAYRAAQLGIQRFSEIGGLTMTDVSLGGATDAGKQSAGWASLWLSNIGTQDLSVGNTKFLGGDLDYIQNGTTSDIDAKGATFDTTDDFAIEDGIVHKMDLALLGLVEWKEGQFFVTSNTAGIQHAINLSDAGDTVNVDGSTYSEHLTIDKELKLKGFDTTLQAVDGTPLVTVTASNVNIDPITFDGMNTTNYGISAAGLGAIGLTVDGNTFQNFNRAGVYVAANGVGTGDIKGNTFKGSSTRGVETGRLRGGYTLNITDNKIGTAGSEVVNGLLFGRIDRATVNVSGGSINSRGDGIHFKDGTRSGADVNISNTRIVSSADEAIDFQKTVRSGSTVDITGGTYIGGKNGVEFSAINGDVTVETATINGRGTDKRGINLLGAITGNFKVSGSSVFGGDDGIGSNDSQNNVVDGGLFEVTTSTVVGRNGNGIELGEVKNDALVNIKNNTRITGDDNGVEFAGDVTDGSLIEISGNTMINGRNDDGVVFKGDTSNFINRNEQEILIANNTIVGGDDGVSFEGEATTKNDIVVRDNVRIVGQSGHGVAHTGGLNNAEIAITGNTLIRGQEDGVRVSGDLKNTSTVDILSNTNIRGVNDDGVHVEDTARAGGVDVNINDNTNIHNTGENGIQVSNINGVEIARNTTRNTGLNGISVSGGTKHDINTNVIRRAGNDGIRLRDFGNAWVAYNNIKWTGDDGIDAQDGDFVSIYDNYTDLSGFLPNELGPFPANVATDNRDANGIYVENVGDDSQPDLLPVEITEAGFGFSVYGADVEIYGNDVANAQDDGIQVSGEDDHSNPRDIDHNEYSAYIVDNIVGHTGDDGIDVDDVSYLNVSDNAVTLAGDKGITVDGGHYAGIFDNRILLTGNDGIEVENVRYNHDVEITAFGDDGYGHGWAVNVSGNEVAMTGKDGIEVKNSDATLVSHNGVFMAGMGEGLAEGIDQINEFASETFVPDRVAPKIQAVVADDWTGDWEVYESFGWKWGNGHGINVHGIDGAYDSPNGWAADIRGNTVKYAGGHGILAEGNDRTRIKNNRVKYAGVSYSTFSGTDSMLNALNEGPFQSRGRRDLWASSEDGMIAVLDGYFGDTSEPQEVEYVTLSNFEFDAHDGIHAENINAQSLDGKSKRNYLFDLKIKGNKVRITGDDGIEVNGAGRTLIEKNKVRDAGHGQSVDYGSGDYTGADGIHVRNVSADLYDGRRKLVGRDSKPTKGYDYEPDRNYALIIRENNIKRTADDGIEVVGQYQEVSDTPTVSMTGQPVSRGYGTTDRVLIAENVVRRSGDRSDFRKGQGEQDGYGHDGIHVRGIYGERYNQPEWNVNAVQSTEGQSAGSNGYGYYGYAVDVILNDVKRSGDDGIEVANSSSTLIDDNDVSRSGYNNRRRGPQLVNDILGADGIHVRNVWNGGKRSEGLSAGSEFKPYSVVIRNNEVDKSGDDGIQVLFSGDTRVEKNTISNSGTRRGESIFGGDGINIVTGTRGFFGQNSVQSMFGPRIQPVNVEVVRNTVSDSLDDGVQVVGATNVLVRKNTVSDSGDDGINVLGFADLNIDKEVDSDSDTAFIVRDSYYPYTPDFRARIIKNTVTNSGTEAPETDSDTVEFRTPYDFGRFGGDGIQVEGFDRIVVRGNEVSDSVENGLYVSGPNNGKVIVDGNTFTENDIGAHFESGEINFVKEDREGNVRDGNIFNGGRVGLKFSPFEFETREPKFAMQAIRFGINERDIYGKLFPSMGPKPFGGFADLSLKDDDGAGGFGGTIGAQLFNGQSQFFIELDNGAFFDPGTPTILSALDSTFVTPFGNVTPSSQGNVLSAEEFDFINGRIFDFRDRGDLGLFFFGVEENFVVNQEELFNTFDPYSFGGGNVQVTILGLPSTSAGGGTPAGAFSPTALNSLSPAAGDGELSPEELNEIESAAGGESEESACWSDATSSAENGGATTFSFGSTLGADTIDAEGSCGS